MDSPFFILVAVTFCFSAINHLIVHSYAVESPKYTLVHSESDYEIRLYREVSWMSAAVKETSFQKSTKAGFHRIYQYIHGANLNSSQLPMTAPVVTTITTASPSPVNYVRLFLSKANPPQPNPELNLQLVRWSTQYVAVRKFSGFAQDDNIKKEMEALVSSLSAQPTGQTAARYNFSSSAIARYNSSHISSGRLNEVWIDVTGFNIEGC